MDCVMAINKLPTDKRYVVLKSDKYCAAALVCLSLAIFFLSVVVFTLNPYTIWGILSVCIGVLLVICTIILFALYSHYLKEEERQQAIRRPL